MDKKMKEQVLCKYRDEALGAKPIPLTVDCGSIKTRVSSSYFTDVGIDIIFLTDETDKILGVQLGDKIRVSLADLKQGMTLSPLGLIPAHVLQLDAGFNCDHGGAIYFGYLKKIFTFTSLVLTAKAILNKLFLTKKNTSSDLVSHWSQRFGNNNWGKFQVWVCKDENGNWQVHTSENTEQRLPVLELIAQFSVSQRGVALGIEKMYTTYSKETTF